MGFISLFGWATRESFLPTQTVTVTPVIVTRAEVQQEGTPLFQAAAPIEPRPKAVVVTAVAPALCDKPFGVDGTQLKIGEIVDKLIDVDDKRG